MTLKRLALGASLTIAISLLSACGGGGSTSGGGSTGSDSSDIVRYPYETVFGDACRSTSEVTPGCTFVRATGQRATVSADPSYNSQGFGSDDVWYVKFDSSGRALVYDDLGRVQKDAYGNDKVYRPSDFAGYIAGSRSTIGVGVTGAFWEDVAGKQYWFGKNGVLFSANTNASNYGQAINNKNAGQANNTNSKAIKSASNISLIQSGAKNLEAMGLKADKALAVASALNSMAVMSAERGAITESDYNRAFTTMSGGVEFRDALKAFKSYSEGDKAPARELTRRSGAALGLSADENEAYVKALYRQSLSKWGYDVDQISLKD